MKSFETCIASFVFLLAGCGTTETGSGGPKIGDSEVFALVQNSTFSFYQNNSSRIPSQGGAHGHFIVKFNPVAAQALGSDGKLPEGAQFPEGSLIVKEAYSGATGPLTVYAVMLKKAGDGNAANGWIWAEYRESGSPAISSASKGSSCTSCHSTSGQRDYVRVFGLYP